MKASVALFSSPKLRADHWQLAKSSLNRSVSGPRKVACSRDAGFLFPGPVLLPRSYWLLQESGLFSGTSMISQLFGYIWSYPDFSSGKAEEKPSA